MQRDLCGHTKEVTDMEKKIKTICPYCASGCEILLTVENDEIICAEPGQGRNNQGELC